MGWEFVQLVVGSPAGARRKNREEEDDENGRNGEEMGKDVDEALVEKWWCFTIFFGPLGPVVAQFGPGFVFIMVVVRYRVRNLRHDVMGESSENRCGLGKERLGEIWRRENNRIFSRVAMEISRG